MIPRLETLQDDHPDWKDRVEIIAVSIDDKREDAAQCCTKNQWTKIKAAWAGPSICEALHISGLPTTYLIDQQGKVVAADNSLNIAEVVRTRHLLGNKQ